MKEEKIVKVNIGSGPHGKEDWINLDWGILPFLSKCSWLLFLLTRVNLLPKSYYRPWPSNPRLWDCRKKLPFKDKTVDFIYTSHFLEHLPRYQAIKLLKECRRVLREDGILRVSVPDVKILTEKYLRNDIVFFRNMTVADLPESRLNTIGDLFVHHFYGYDIWNEPGFLQKIQRKFIRSHLWMYDFASLAEIMKVAGFNNIRQCVATEGNLPDIDFLDIHKENSLFVEASEHPPKP